MLAMNPIKRVLMDKVLDEFERFKRQRRATMRAPTPGLTGAANIGTQFYRSDVWTDSEAWSFVENAGLIVFHPSPYYLTSIAAATTGIQGVISQPLNTSPRVAFELWGIAVYASLASGSGSGSAVDLVQGTYYQPSPPAPNTTTPASGTGNLVLRNYYLQSYLQFQVDQVTAAGYGIEFGRYKNYYQAFTFFRRPLRLVGTSLAMWHNLIQNGEGVYITLDVQWFGRYVDITENEYVNLVALATGSAILPPTILGAAP